MPICSGNYFETINNWSGADNFSENAYGTYIFHYGFVTWLQFGLLTHAMPAAAKFFITFSVALIASWFLTDFLRKTVLGRILGHPGF